MKIREGKFLDDTILEVRKALQKDGWPEVRSLYQIEGSFSFVERIELTFPDGVVDIHVKTFEDTQGQITNAKGVDRARQEYSSLSYAYDLFKDETTFKVVRPLALFEGKNTVVTLTAPGENLQSLIKRPIVRNEKAIIERKRYTRLCGMWLQRFQCLTDNGRKSGPAELKTLSEFIEKQLVFCEKNRLFSRSDLSERIRLWLQEKCKNFTESHGITIAEMHGDFIPLNICVSEQEVTVLDFSRIKEGPACRDVISFLSNLEFFSFHPLIRSHYVERLKDAFLQGYGKEIELENPFVALYNLREILSYIINNQMISRENLKKNIKLYHYNQGLLKCLNRLLCR